MRAVSHKRSWGLVLFAFPACAQVLSLDDFGGTGAAPARCETSEDCAEDVPACFEATCDSGICGSTARELGATCGDGRECDAIGNCLTALGEECSAADECTSSSCVDGECCGVPSCDVCFACGGEACMPREAGSTPDDCGGACDGDGDCALGTLDYGKILGETGAQEFFDLALLPDGGAVAVGFHIGPLTLGNLAVTGDPMHADALVVKVDARGVVVWAQSQGNLGYHDQALGVAVADDGAIAVVGFSALAAGNVGGLLIFDQNGQKLNAGVALPGAGIAHDVECVGLDVLVGGSTDALPYAPFVTRYSRAGVALQTAVLGTDVTSAGEVLALTLAKDGGVLLAGGVKGTMMVGNAIKATDHDAFVAKLDKDLNGEWIVSFPAPGTDQAIDVAEAPNGDVIVGGHYSGTDPFVMRLTSGGELVFNKILEGNGNGYLQGVAVDAHGNVIVLGHFNGEIDLGAGPVQASDAAMKPFALDGFVAKYSDDGTHLWSQVFGVPAPQPPMAPTYPGLDRGTALAIEPDTQAIRLVGSTSPAASIAGVNFTGTDPDRGALVARLNP